MASENLKMMSRALDDRLLPPENKLEYTSICDALILGWNMKQMTSKNLKIMSQDLEDKWLPPENKLEYTPWRFQDSNLLDDLLDDEGGGDKVFDLLDDERGRDEAFESLNFL